MDYSFLILLGSMIISRWILIGAFQKLTDEEKAKVLSAKVIRLSQITLITTVIMVIVFYFAISNYPTMFRGISVTFFAAILLQRGFAYFITRKNMIANDIPVTYRKRFFLSWLLTTAGVVAFILLLMQNIF